MSGITPVGIQYSSMVTNGAAIDALLNYNNPATQDSGFSAMLSGLFDGNSGSAAASGNAGSLLNAGGLSSGTLGALLGLGDAGAASALYPATLNNKAALEAAIGSSGPLPTYLRQLVAGLRLDAAQTQSLYDITASHMDIVKSPETVQELADELTQAGIALA